MYHSYYYYCYGILQLPYQVSHPHCSSTTLLLPPILLHTTILSIGHTSLHYTWPIFQQHNNTGTQYHRSNVGWNYSHPLLMSSTPPSPQHKISTTNHPWPLIATQILALLHCSLLYSIPTNSWLGGGYYFHPIHNVFHSSPRPPTRQLTFPCTYYDISWLLCVVS